MSIVAMVDNEVLKEEGKPPATAARRSTRRAARQRRGDPSAPAAVEEQTTPTRTGDVIGSLVSYVPTEAIAAYLVLLPFMDPSSTGAESTSALVGNESFTGRWYLVAGVALLVIVYTLGYRQIAAIRNKQSFAFPWVPLVTALLGFAAWVFAIPASPFNDFGFYTPELGGAVGSIAATAIAFVGAVTGETLTYAKQQGPA